MTIPYIPQIDPSITDSLASLGDTISRIARPTLSYDIALRQSLAEHPELIQQLANIGARNPGQLQRFVGPKAAAALGNVQQSPEDLASQLGATVKAKAAKTIIGGFNSLPNNTLAQAGQSGALQATSGQTPKQLAQDQAELSTIQLGQQLPQNPKAATYNGKPYNPDDVAKDFLAGKAPAQLDAQLRANPTYSGGYLAAIENHQKLNQINAEYSRAVLFAGTKSDTEYARIANEAGVTTDLVKNYNTNPLYQQMAISLANNPGSADTPEKQELLKFVHYLSSNAQKTAQAQLAPARAEIAKAEQVLDSKTATDAQKAQAATQYTDALHAIGVAQQDTSFARVSYEPIAFGMGRRPVYYDKDGNKVDKNAITNFVSSVIGSNTEQPKKTETNTNTKLTPEDQSKVNSIIKLIRDKKATLDEVKAHPNVTPQILQAVTDSIGAK